MERLFNKFRNACATYFKRPAERRGAAGLSLEGKISTGFVPAPQEDIYAHQFSCLNRKEDCVFCRKMDGVVIAATDPILKPLMSNSHPDEDHPFGRRTKTFQALCSCHPCTCMWVDILKDEEHPPAPNMPEELRTLVTTVKVK